MLNMVKQTLIESDFRVEKKKYCYIESDGRFCALVSLNSGDGGGMDAS